MAEAVRTGPKTKCTNRVIEAIAGSIEVGVSVRDAAQAAGVGISAVYDWLRRAEAIEESLESGERTVKDLTRDEKQYRKFRAEFQEAEAVGAVNMATVVYNAGMGDPDYALKWLRARRPEQWSERGNLDVKHSGGLGLTHDGQVEVSTPQIVVYIPDNGRGDSAAARTEEQPPAEMSAAGDING